MKFNSIRFAMLTTRACFKTGTEPVGSNRLSCSFINLRSMTKKKQALGSNYLLFLLSKSNLSFELMKKQSAQSLQHHINLEVVLTNTDKYFSLIPK